MVKERGIIMSADSVAAILAGSKTQTRRVAKPQPLDDKKPVTFWFGWPGVAPSGVANHVLVSPWRPKDRLWVREAFYQGVAPPGMEGAPQLRRGEEINNAHSPWHSYTRVAWSVSEADPGGWVSNRSKVSPLFMPRWASRLLLTVTGVRLERLQAISEADAVAEGCSAGGGVSSGPMDPYETDGYTAVEEYAALWDELNGKRSGCAWKDDPWVWVISFERVTA